MTAETGKMLRIDREMVRMARYAPHGPEEPTSKSGRLPAEIYNFYTKLSASEAVSQFGNS